MCASGGTGIRMRLKISSTKVHKGSTPLLRTIQEKKMKDDTTKSNQNPGYQPAEFGPFHCGNCEYYVEEDSCKKPEMIKFYGGKPYAEVDSEGCCNYFETLEKEE